MKTHNNKKSSRPKRINFLEEMSDDIDAPTPPISTDHEDKVRRRRCKDPALQTAWADPSVIDAVLTAMAHASIASGSSFDKTLGYVYKFISWLHTQNMPTEPAEAFRLDNIEAFIAGYMNQRLVSDSRTPDDCARRLMKVAESIPGTGHKHAAKPNSGRKAVAAPMDPTVREAYEEALAELPASTPVHRARLVWSLAAGAGGNGGEIGRTRIADITTKWGVTVVRFPSTRSSAPRDVPIQTEYLQWVHEACDAARAEKNREWVIPVGNRNNVAAQTFGRLPIVGYGTPDISQLVSTYRVRLLQAPIPFSLVMYLCGLKTSHSLTDLLAYVPDRPNNDLETWINTLTEGTGQWP